MSQSQSFEIPPMIFFNLKISAIIEETHLKFSVPVLIVSRDRKVSQICYLGPRFFI